MSDTGAGEGRLELHLEATGRGRRMVARLADGSVLATGRHYTHLLENIRKEAAARYPSPVKLALLVGRPSRAGGRERTPLAGGTAGGGLRPTAP